MLLLTTGLAFAHSVTFGARQLSVAPDSASEAWALMDGWGVVYTEDAGGTWTWVCDEAFNAGPVYDVLALGGGRAAIATGIGVLRVDDTCGSTALSGLPDNTYATLLVRWGGGMLVGVFGAEQGGVASCDDTACTPTALWGAGVYPKSLRVDGDHAWATTLQEDTLAATLLRSADGVTWDVVHTWPLGDVDPVVLGAEGDTLWVWAGTRDADHAPGLLVSDDGGRTFAEVLTTGTYTDPAPGFARVGGVALLGVGYTPRTWRSADGGHTWADVTDAAPAVRCSEVVGDAAWVCADHLKDGFDVAQTTDGVGFSPVACLEDAVPSECATDACAASADSYFAAGAVGGGQCTAVVEDPPDGSTRGCGGGAAGLALGPLAWGGRRRWGRATRGANPPREHARDAAPSE